MSATDPTERRKMDPGTLRDEWVSRLSDLTRSVRRWAEELDWSTRQIGKKMKDSRLGLYEAPALIMQKGTTRVLLDPVARFAPGADGVVDLYLMQRGYHRELSNANRTELLGMKRRSTYAGSGKIDGRLASLSYWSTISAGRRGAAWRTSCLVPLNPESPTADFVSFCSIH